MKAARCNLCGADDWRIRFPARGNHTSGPDVDAYKCTSAGYGSHLQIVECRQCGHVYSNPRYDASELLEAYSDVEDDTYIVERAGREKTFAKHLKSLEKFTGSGSNRDLLDVGAYIGVFVEIALANGWQAMGIEPSQWAIDFAHQKGLPLVQGTLDAPEIQGRRYDVITMWDVIEHLDDPAAELDKSFRLLRPGGLVAVHTMDIDSPIARVMGGRWPWLMDMHIHYFSQDTLIRFIKKSGFEILWSGSQGRYLSLGYLASRVQGMSKPLGSLANIAVNFMGSGEVLVPVNLGDLITVYARRPEKVTDKRMVRSDEKA